MRVARGSIIITLFAFLSMTGAALAKEDEKHSKGQEKRLPIETVQQCINKAYAQYQSSLKEAMKSRKVALKTSVDTFSISRKQALAKKDRDAIKVSVNILRDDRKTALVTYANAQKKAVQARKVAIASCKKIKSN